MPVPGLLEGTSRSTARRRFGKLAHLVQDVGQVQDLRERRSDIDPAPVAFGEAPLQEIDPVRGGQGPEGVIVEPHTKLHKVIEPRTPGETGEVEDDEPSVSREHVVGPIVVLSARYL